MGSPSLNAAPDRELTEFLVTALSWLAAFLRFDLQEDDAIPLVAGQATYPIPKSLLWIVWIDLGGKLLTPTTTWAINSNNSTTSPQPGSAVSWNEATPSTPTQYACEGNQLILNPPPDATTVAAFPTMKWRYIASGAQYGEQDNIGLGKTGKWALTDLDEQLLVYNASVGWLSAHLLGADQNSLPAMQAQIAALTAEIDRLTPKAKQVWMQRISDEYPQLRLDTSGRFIGAR